MNGLIAIAEQLFISRLLSSHAPLTGKSKIGLGFLALSGFFLFMCMCFAVYAAYLYLSAHYTPDIAAALAAGFSFILAALCALGAYAIHCYRQYRMKRVKAEILHMVHQVLNYLDDELGEPVREHPGASVTAATLAGYAAGQRFL